jgi:hypothetical protein
MYIVWRTCCWLLLTVATLLRQRAAPFVLAGGRLQLASWQEWGICEAISRRPSEWRTHEAISICIIIITRMLEKCSVAIMTHTQSTLYLALLSDQSTADLLLLIWLLFKMWQWQWVMPLSVLLVLLSLLLPLLLPLLLSGNTLKAERQGFGG